MSYSAKVVLDSIAVTGARITTLEVVMPRFVLAEFNTHRIMSKNSESSRAVPPEQRISVVASQPFIPMFGARVRGMGQGVADKTLAAAAISVWKQAARDAAKWADMLNALSVDKSHVNRLLEPFLWHKVVCTATTWTNFLGLRCPPGMEPSEDFPAQMEIQAVAIAMREALRASSPQLLEIDEWHTPYDGGRDWESALASAGRCATVSYARVKSAEERHESLARCARLRSSGHWSPLEHQGQVTEDKWKRSGNFVGWMQLRKYFPGESNAAALDGRTDLEDLW